ncbi:tripartite tricarboxylate transporter substrate binding protein [Aquincola sp. S2]|uniref:Tripartite tricarboxylate transporter substrate binding protein n=1 Tax=Pseudaquabacterium terrae TaxID=2732868 RepID=A0ABX2EEI7_9BURK|nr:tripartite tricarboxylate transporter substrate binding protein [Aquabacterium terrae]NRF67038.1 tripartite tricarboxylate transporter substrate binding protein [Aquabacterium terrae]
MTKRTSLERRLCVLALAAAATAGLATPAAHAQGYPSKPVKIIVPFAPGGATDILARLLAEKMAPKMGQPVLVENKPGAAGIVGTDLVAKSPPDGHTIVLGLSNSLLTNQFLYEKLPYNVERDLTLVSQIAVAPLLLIAHPSIPANNAGELMQYIGKNKGKLSYGSYGIGAYPHLAGAHMSDVANGDMSHVPYKGEAPMVQDLIGGQIHIAYASALQAKPHIEAGKLKVLGVTGENRIATLPNVPTMAEQGLKDEAYRLTGWLAIAAPANTPKPVLQRLADELRAACEQPDVKARIVAMGFDVRANTPEQFAAVYKRELPVWQRMVKQSGAKLE